MNQKALEYSVGGAELFQFPMTVQEEIVQEHESLDETASTSQGFTPQGSHSGAKADYAQKHTLPINSFTYREELPQDGVMRIPSAIGYRRNLDEEAIKSIREEVRRYAEELAKRYGMRCNSVGYNQGEGSRYGSDSTSLNVVMSLSLVNPLGLDKYARDFLAHAPDFGLAASLYSTIIEYESVEYFISGLDVDRAKVRLTSTDKSVLMTPELLIDLMKTVQG